MERAGRPAPDPGPPLADPSAGATSLAATICVAAIAAWAWAALALAHRVRRGRPAVPSRPREPVPWSAGDVAVVVGTYVAAMAVAGLTLPEKPPLADGLFAATAASLLATIAAAGWLHGRGATTRSLGLVAGCWRQDIGLAVGGLAFVLAPLLALAGLLDRIVPYRHDLVDYLRDHHEPGDVGLVVISAVVAAPLAEEFFFRRVLQGWLERTAPIDAWMPVMGSALAFGLAHFAHGLAWVPLALLGLVLGRIAQRTGSIIPCILLHAMFNAVSVMLLLAQMTRPGAG